ncbi:MAG: transporter substrate-binding domain-containing protein, partial [Rhodoplanes sp.]
AVANGEADAASNDMINLTMMHRASDHPERYEIIDIGDRFDKKPFGVAVKKGNHPFIDLLNRAVEALKAAVEIDRLFNKNLEAAGSRSA